MNDDNSPNKRRSGKYTRNCIICGEAFHTNSKTRQLCYIPHTRECCICGNAFPADVYFPAKTCSSKCASELRAQNCLEKYGVRSNFQLESNKEKAKQTSLKRYGVENPMLSKEVQGKVRQTNLEKYGVEWSVQREDVKEKTKQTNLERYGVEWACTSEQVREKTRQTNLDRYGVEYTFQSKEFQEQSKKSNLERYGTEYYVQSDDFKEKAQATWMYNYGVDNPFKSQEIQKRGEATSLEKYGTRRPQQSEEIKEKIRETNILNKAASIPDEEARKRYLEFRKNPKSYLDAYITDHPDTTPTSISNMLGFEDTTIVLDLLHQYGHDLIANNLSSMESAIVEFIKSIDESIQIEVHNRKIIQPKEIDIYLPEYNIGIECNPTYTHNSTHSLDYWFNNGEDKPISSNYHRDKSVECQKQGVFLFHIFGYEWNARPYVIQSMLRNLLGKNLHKYYARKLEVKLVSGKTSTGFLNTNHRQGAAQSSVNLGLYDGEELVSLMTFGKTRSTIGKHEKDDNTVWELIRFCNKINTSVVGGASKLFSYFLKNYEVSKVVSFSDVAHTRGGLYEKLGFKYIHTSEPGYGWVHLNTDMFLNRVTCQKQNLPKLFNEPDLDIKNQTEKQIMSDHGFVQVFDAGVIRWEYTRD